MVADVHDLDDCGGVGNGHLPAAAGDGYPSLVFQGGTAETLLDISFWPDVSLLDLVFC